MKTRRPKLSPFASGTLCLLGCLALVLAVAARAEATTPDCVGRPDGTACNDGSACTRTDVCKRGSCVGGNPVVCTGLDACHPAGTCDPSNGACSQPIAKNGTSCSDGLSCTSGDNCQAGVCTPTKTSCACASDADCPALGACSTNHCDPGTHKCLAAPKPKGSACSDANACTGGDACDGTGKCATTTTVKCLALDQCHVAGTCNPGSGACSNPPKTNGTSCNDGRSCTTGETCQSAVCTAAVNHCACNQDADCPADTCRTGKCTLPASTCSLVAKPNGTACTDDGNLCTSDVCTSGACAHPPGHAGTVCRASAGACDVPESCTGSSANCPTDAKSTAVCRTSAGPCDVAESCNGTGNDCPSDGFQSAATVCRTAAGTCDVAENCTGSAAGCPADAKSTAVCRAAAGPCDIAESCNGSGDDCPANGFQSSGTVCRPSAAPCDAAESCTGSSAACPADALSPDGAACSDGNVCNGPETCHAGDCAPCGAIVRASVDSAGAQAGDYSDTPSISADGRFVAFFSDAANLVTGDTNGLEDVFVRDLQSGTTTRASVDSSGVEGNDNSYSQRISADGRFVAFASYATNLVADDDNWSSDIFVHDNLTGTTTRVSVDSAGAQGDSSSDTPSISADGRYVAFVSYASNLVAGDSNFQQDVFVHDMVTGTTTRASVDSAGGQTSNVSYTPSISADGRYVAFQSWASDLVAGDTNGNPDVFVHDMVTGTTTRVSVDSAGAQPVGGFSSYPSISADGRYVAFVSGAANLVAGDTNDLDDVFVRDTVAGTTVRVSVDSTGAQANSQSSDPPAISADGRFVAFDSYASNLVANDTNNLDVFVHDLVAGTTTRVSVDAAGTQGNQDSYTPTISADGSIVTFFSYASNLVAGDTNGTADIFVVRACVGLTCDDDVKCTSDSCDPVLGCQYDLRPAGASCADGTSCNGDETCDASGACLAGEPATRETTRVSLDSTGTQGNGSSDMSSTSADGRYVAFSSNASNLVAGDTNGVGDVFVRDTLTGTTTRVSVSSAGAQADAECYAAAISADGRYVTFASLASTLVPSDTNASLDIFVRDTVTGTTSRASVSSAGAQGNLHSDKPAISADGRYVAFVSSASNFVASDTNSQYDAFVRDTVAGTTTRVSVDSAGAQANGASISVAISGDGRYVAFYSYASNLVAGDTNGVTDVFVHDMVTGATTRASVDSAGAQADWYSYQPAISADGRFVAFVSDSSNLVAGDNNGDTDVFVRDTVAGTTTRVSVDSTGGQANGGSVAPSISADGRLVAFESGASNLADDDTNDQHDVFVHDLVTGTTTRIGVGSTCSQASGYNSAPSISANGQFVAFSSTAANIVAGDTNGATDVFVTH